MSPPVATQRPDSVLLDVTTTSIGRELIRETYESFLRNVRFDGGFNVIVTVDPVREVSESERSDAIAFLRDLPSLDRRIAGVSIETWERNIGLERSLLTLLSLSRADYGIHLEDDWRLEAELDLDALLLDLRDQDSTLIAFNNAHVAAGGTFERAGESEPVAGTRVPLVRLTRASWAADYLPFSPHLHQSRRWVPAVVRALMLDFDPDRCPEERVKDAVARTGARSVHNVLWTRDVIATDTGRGWHAAREVSRDIFARPSGPDLGAIDGRGGHDRERRLVARARSVTVMAGGDPPLFVSRADGARVADVDGNVYLDYVAADGAAALGHAHPAIAAAARSQLRRAGATGRYPELLVKAAERVTAAVPGAERVLFAATPGDALALAAGAARLATRRRLVAVCTGAPPPPGPVIRFDPAATDGTTSLAALLARHAGDIACVIMRPPVAPPLVALRASSLAAQCRAAGALLVFDEAMTGFRLALGGAQEHLQVRPDLTCLSHALAAGMPLAAVCGSSELVAAADGDRDAAEADPLSLAAAVAAIKEYRTTDYLDRIWRLGRRLADGLNAAAHDLGVPQPLAGDPPLPFLRLEPEEGDDRTAAFVSALARRGVLMRPGLNFITGAHTGRDVDLTVAAGAEALRESATRVSVS